MTSPRYTAQGSWLRPPRPQPGRWAQPAGYAGLPLAAPDDWFLTVTDHTGALLSLTQSLAVAERVGSAARGNVIYYGPSARLNENRP